MPEEHMPERRWSLVGLGVSSLAAALVIAAAAFWLWRGYRMELLVQDHALVVEGETVLEMLETGVRFHCRIGSGAHDFLDRMLAEYATAPRVRGLCVLSPEGAEIARGGEIPAGLHPPQVPVRAGPEARSFLLRMAAPQGVVMARMGWVSPPAAGGGALEERLRDGRSHLTDMVWLAVYLDTEQYALMRESSRRRFYLSVGMTGAVVLLGVALVLLGLGQNRMAAQLAMRSARLRELEDRALLGAGLAHETKNPLGLIRGLAQSLVDAEEVKPDEVRTCADEVIDEVDRVVGRINSFLEYARAASPDPEPVRLDELVGHTAGYFLDEAQAKGIDLERRLEPVEVRADPRMVRQVVVNLVANALAACDSGARIDIVLASAGRRRWRLEVRDTGAGIPPEDLGRVLQPYFSKREGGTGLGLAIVHQITRAHGWRLGVDSMVGRGTTVTIVGERLRPGDERL